MILLKILAPILTSPKIGTGDRLLSNLHCMHLVPTHVVWLRAKNELRVMLILDPPRVEAAVGKKPSMT